MKKVLTVLLMTTILILSSTFCLADPYENNPDYYFVNVLQRVKKYLYLPSVEVQEYNPPHYQIRGHFVSSKGDYVGHINYEDRTVANALFRVAYGMDFYQ